MGSVDVVIPVLNEAGHTESILGDICNNTVQPRQVIVIDNGSTDQTSEVIEKFDDSLPLRYIQNSENIGVNASWNLGISLATADYVSVLNNDLILNKYFFAGIIKTFDLNLNCAMTCPKTVQGSDENQRQAVRNCVIRKENCVSHVPWRWGWAFTIRRDVGLKVLIPRVLFNYCGDDYHYYFIKLLGYDILCMEDNYIYHYGNVTGRNSGLDRKMHDDTHQWNCIKERISQGEDWRRVLQEHVALAAFGKSDNGDGNL